MELDKSMIGLSGPVYTFDVEKRHSKQFAEAIGDMNGLYTDETYAERSPYGKLVVPPTFPVAIASDSGGIPIDLDARRMLHGEQEFIYHRSISPGDRLYCQMKVADLYDREGKSGPMQFLVLDTEMKDEAGEMVAVSRMNIIYRTLKK